MAHRQKIKMIAFDLGGVLIEVDKSGIESAFFEGQLFEKLTLGEITPEIYFSSLCEKTKRTRAHLEENFRKMVRPHNFCNDLIASLKIPFVLWSNINLCHFEQILKSCAPLRRYGAATTLSFQIGHCKPDADFFEKGMELAQVHPSELMFIDDKKTNVDTAMTLGIQACLAKNQTQIWEVLRSASLTES